MRSSDRLRASACPQASARRRDAQSAKRIEHQRSSSPVMRQSASATIGRLQELVVFRVHGRPPGFEMVTHSPQPARSSGTADAKLASDITIELGRMTCVASSANVSSEKSITPFAVRIASRAWAVCPPGGNSALIRTFMSTTQRLRFIGEQRSSSSSVSPRSWAWRPPEPSSRQRDPRRRRAGVRTHRSK